MKNGDNDELAGLEIDLTPEGEFDLEQYISDNPDAEAEIAKRVAFLERIGELDAFKLAHLAINQAADYGDEIMDPKTTPGRLRHISGKLCFSVTALAKRLLVDNPPRRIVGPGGRPN